MSNTFFQLSSARIEQIDRLIGEFIALDFEPYRVVEHDGFKRLLNTIAPGYKIRSRQYYKETVMSRISEGLRKEIKGRLETASTYSFTVDTWSETTANVELMR